MIAAHQPTGVKRTALSMDSIRFQRNNGRASNGRIAAGAYLRHEAGYPAVQFAFADVGYGASMRCFTMRGRSKAPGSRSQTYPSLADRGRW